MIIINGVTYRNLQEQVAKNKADIEACLTAQNVISIGTITENKTIQVAVNTTYYIECSLISSSNVIVHFNGFNQIILSSSDFDGISSMSNTPTEAYQYIEFQHSNSNNTRWRIDINSNKIAIVSKVYEI